MPIRIILKKHFSGRHDDVLFLQDYVQHLLGGQYQIKMKTTILPSTT
jgi:hypothetical protein